MFSCASKDDERLSTEASLTAIANGHATFPHDCWLSRAMDRQKKPNDGSSLEREKEKRVVEGGAIKTVDEVLSTSEDWKPRSERLAGRGYGDT